MSFADAYNVPVHTCVRRGDGINSPDFSTTATKRRTDFFRENCKPDSTFFYGCINLQRNVQTRFTLLLRLHKYSRTKLKQFFLENVGSVVLKRLINGGVIVIHREPVTALPHY